MLTTTPTITWSTKYVTAKTARIAAHQQAGDDRRDQPGQQAVGQRSDQRGEEGPGEQLALDGDVDHAGTLAEDAGQRAEDQRDAEQHGALQQAGHRDGLARHHPGQERHHERDAVEGDGPRRDRLALACPHQGQAGQGQADQRPSAGRTSSEGTTRSGSATASSPERCKSNVVVSPEVPAQAEEDEREQPQDPHEDRGLVGDGQQDLGLGGWPGRERCRLPCVSAPSTPALGARRRKILRTRGGAAMNSTIRDCTTSTMSIGRAGLRPASTSHRPAGRPSGCPRTPRRSGCSCPSSATVMASNPISPAMPLPSAYSVAPPRIWFMPARPARPPAITMTPVSARLTLMPAVRAAFGLAPTARNSNPIVERSRSHQTKPGRQQGEEEAEVQPVVLAQDLGQARRRGHGRAQRVVATGPLERVEGEQVLQEVDRDPVEHDRHDHLVGPGLGLEHARDAAPDARRRGGRRGWRRSGGAGTASRTLKPT